MSWWRISAVASAEAAWAWLVEAAGVEGAAAAVGESSTVLAITLWWWGNGSSAREVRCRNDATVQPVAGTGLPSTRPMAARSSSQSSAQSLPAWIAPSTAARVGSPRRASTPRDFSVVRVRSKPTRTAGGRRRSRNAARSSRRTSHGPPVPRWATRYAWRGRRPRRSRVDVVRVGLVVLGEAAEVPGGHAGQPGGFGDRELFVGRAEGGDLVGAVPPGGRPGSGTARSRSPTGRRPGRRRARDRSPRVVGQLAGSRTAGNGDGGPTSSIVSICLAGRPSTAAASLARTGRARRGRGGFRVPTPSRGRRPAEPWAPRSRASVAGSRRQGPWPGRPPSPRRRDPGPRAPRPRQRPGSSPPSRSSAADPPRLSLGSPTPGPGAFGCGA